MPFMTYGHIVHDDCERHEGIALRAYFKWLAAAKPEGRDLEFWLAAEEEHQKACLETECFAAATLMS